MEKKTNKYLLSLRLLQTSNGEGGNNKQIELELENHDEIFQIIDRIREKDPFGNKAQASEFVIGLKMFGEVMLKNRNHPLFDELRPAFQTFMKRLKSK